MWIGAKKVFFPQYLAKIKNKVPSLSLRMNAFRYIKTAGPDASGFL